MKKPRKRLGALLLAVCLLVTGAVCAAPPAGAVAAYMDFKDLAEDSSYSNYLNQSFLDGFFFGTSVTTFAPDRNLTRGEGVTVLGRMHEKISGQTILSPVEDPYPDVKTTRFYGKYIAWAKETGVLAGETGEQFRPEEPVIKKELVGWLEAYLRLLLEEKIPVRGRENSELARFIELWKDPVEQEKLLAPVEAKDVLAAPDYPLLWHTGTLNADKYQAEGQPVSRMASAALFVDFCQGLIFKPIDTKTPRISTGLKAPKYGPTLKPVEEDSDTETLPAPDGQEQDGTDAGQEETLPEAEWIPPASDWEAFSITGVKTDTSKRIQRGMAVLKSFEEFHALEKFLAAAGVAKGFSADRPDCPALQVDEPFFEDHDLLVVELASLNEFGGQLTEFGLEQTRLVKDPDNAEDIGTPEYRAELSFRLFGYLSNYVNTAADVRQLDESEVQCTLFAFALNKGTQVTDVQVDFEVRAEMGQPIGTTANPQ